MKRYSVIGALMLCAAALIAQLPKPGGSGGGGGGGGTGDVAGPAASTDNECTIYNSTTGKILKRGTGCSIDPATGVLTVTGGLNTGDGTKTAGTLLPELTANGTSLWGLFGAESQSANICYFGNTTDTDPGQVWVDSGTTSTAHLPDGSTLTCSNLVPASVATLTSCADTGSTDAYACNFPVCPGALETGGVYRLKVGTVNTLGATVNFCSLGAKAIKKWASGSKADPATGDLPDESWLTLIYDGTDMELQTPLGNAPSGGGLTPDGLYLTSGGIYYIGSTFQVATLPTMPSWSWRNQGGAAVSTTGNAVLLSMPASVGSSLRIREIAVPTAPYTCTVGFIPNWAGENYNAAGIALTDGTKVHMLAVSANNAASAGYSIAINTYSNVTTYNGTYITEDAIPASSGVLWLRINDDATDRKSLISLDGLNFRQVHSVSRTDYLTPTTIGFFADDSTSNQSFVVTIVSWKCE